MHTHAATVQDNKSHPTAIGSVAKEASQKQSNGASGIQFVDNRTESIAQRKLQEIANTSPRTIQLKTFQSRADNNSWGQQGVQLAAMADDHSAQQENTIQKQAGPEHSRKENNTGLPNDLKLGIENLSGYSMDDVKVHYNSNKPAQLSAHAYAQGTDIHVASGQEKHLPHEAWHVVQQKKGNVKPTVQLKGRFNINDNSNLEREADVMGMRSTRLGQFYLSNELSPGMGNSGETVVQKQRFSTSTAGNVIQCNYMDEARLYEKNLGQYAYSDVIATGAATTAVNKMKDVMGTTADATNAPRVFGGDDPRYPGNVGKDLGRVTNAINGGNLREKMTAFYNASLGSFKKMLTERLTGQGEWDDIALGIGGLGIGDQGQAALRESHGRMNATFKSSSMKDLYVAPGDPIARSGTDELYKAQSIGKDKKPRIESIDQTDDGALNDLRMTGLAGLTITSADLIGDANASFGNFFKTSIFTKLKTALTALHTARANGDAQAVVIPHLSSVKQLSWKWLKENTSGKSDLEEFREVQPEVREKINAISPLLDQLSALVAPEALANPDAEDQAAAIGALDLTAPPLTAEDDFNVELDSLAGDNLAFLRSALGYQQYHNLSEQLALFHQNAGNNTELVKSIVAMRQAAQAWAVKDDEAEANILATAEGMALKKRLKIEQLQRQLNKVYSSSTRTNNDLQVPDGDATLSDGEKEFIMEKMPAYDLGGANYDDTAELPWEEGATRYVASTNNSWVNDAVTKLKMPVLTGPSGTTDRMFQALKYLGIYDNGVNKYNFRYALLGWMLTSRDHSFHEIMAVAKTYNCNYEAGPDSYKHMQPIAEPLLRANVCRSPGYLHLFPDEVEYHRNIDGGNSVLYEPVRGTLNNLTAHNQLIENQTGLDAANYDDSERPKMYRNVTAYTTTAYHVQNIVANHNKFIAKKMISKLRSNARDRADLIWMINQGARPGPGPDRVRFDAALLAFRDLSFGDKHMTRVVASFPDVTTDQIYEEALQHNKHTQTAMEMLPSFAGPVYRGEAYVPPTPYGQGNAITLGKFWSTSKKTNFADAYATSATGTFTRGVVLEINATDGKDVSAVSVNEEQGVRDAVDAPDTDEVVLLPGSRLVVNQEAHDDATFQHQVVTLTQQ